MYHQPLVSLRSSTPFLVDLGPPPPPLSCGQKTPLDWVEKGVRRRTAFWYHVTKPPPTRRPILLSSFERTWEAGLLEGVPSVLWFGREALDPKWSSWVESGLELVILIDESFFKSALLFVLQ